MKISVETNVLREALKKIQGVVDQKISRPILTNCLLKAERNHLEIIATDLEVATKVVLDVTVETPGVICLNTKNFSEILREMPNDKLVINCDKSQTLHLQCKNINYSLVVTPADEYPQINFSINKSSFKIKSDNVQEFINKTLHAVSTDETRLYLNGIFLQNFENKLRAVAIDGHRLALLDTVEFVGDLKILSEGIIIPRKGIVELKKMAESAAEQEMTFAVDESFIYIKLNDSYTISIRLISRDYPKYQTVIPSKTQHSFLIDKVSLLDAVKRIKILSSEKTNGIKFSIYKNGLKLSTQDPGRGNAEENLDIDYSGNEMEIGFNAKYLMESLQVLPEGMVKIEFNNELSPIVLKSENLNNFLGIIMPLKI